MSRAGFGTMALVALLALAGCGGGGGGSGGGGGGGVNPPPTAGIQGTGRGSITGFGSIFVNGVRYSTTATTFTINGRPGTEAELKVGQVVTVRGTIDSNGTTGSATTVRYDDDLKGPVQAIDVAASRLTVLGQVVIVDGATSFGNVAGLGGLVVGDSVEVSGFRDAAGAIRATRIERQAGGFAELELTGAVAALDTNARTFSIGGQAVDYSTATLLGGISAPANGMLVEVKGTLVGGVLRAREVEREDASLGAASGDRAEVEGLITRYASNADFEVNGIAVITNSGTLFSNGTALAAGVKVEVEGTINASGAIVATKVEIKNGGDSRITARVTSVDAANSRLGVFGIQVSVNVSTRFEDSSRVRQQPFNLTHVNVGDYVEVRGAELAAGYLASFLDRDDLDSRIELRGIARSVDVAQQRLSLFGVAVRLAGGAQCRDVNDATISCAALFAALGPNSIVSARDGNGTASTPGQELVADRLELEN